MKCTETVAMQGGEGVLGVAQKPNAGEAAWDCVFEELFLKYYGPLVITVGRVVGDRGEAEDLAAEAFYRLYKRGPDRGELRNQPGWVYRVAINLALDSLRANARRLRREAEAGVAFSGKCADALEDLLAVEEKIRVRCVLARLKPGEAQILILGSGGMSYREIAVILGLKTDSIYTMVCRARSRFEREYLALYGRRP